MFDSTATEIARYRYNPFGQTSNILAINTSDFGFASMYHHVRSGLYFTPLRAYNSSLGKWISRDPVGISGGNNLYAYANNSPTQNTDPLGLYVSAIYDASTFTLALDIPIQFSGLDLLDTTADALYSAINAAWSGTVMYNGQTINIRVNANSGPSNFF